jgi:hypothetical protein
MRRVDSDRHAPPSAFRALALLLVGAALTLVTSASAANVASNPSFEDVCGAPTKACFWPDSADSFVADQRDTTMANTGSASYRQALFGNARGRLTRSECVDTPLTAGSVTVSFFYRVVAGTNVNLVAFRAIPWSNSGCTGSAATVPPASARPVDDGAWHDVTSRSSLASATRSLRFEISYDCSALCPNTQVNYDDLVVDQALTPTSVTVGAIGVRRGDSRAPNRWQEIRFR